MRGLNAEIIYGKNELSALAEEQLFDDGKAPIYAFISSFVLAYILVALGLVGSEDAKSFCAFCAVIVISTYGIRLVLGGFPTALRVFFCNI